MTFSSILVMVTFASAIFSLPCAAEVSFYSPEVMAYNLRLGSQVFGAQYQFTTNPITLECADRLLCMGSDIVKFSLTTKPSDGKHYSTLLEAVTEDSVYQRLFKMPFRHYFIWTGSAVQRGEWWKKGPDPALEQKSYEEMYAVSRHLLERFSGSGKLFYFGNWEGDWLLMGSGSAAEKRNPDPARIAGMRTWLNARQRGIDDAKRDTPHNDVNIFFYVEVNRVRDAMRTQSEYTNRLVNTVLPFIKNIDYVSYSSYDTQSLSNDEFYKTMDYIEAHLPTNKASSIQGKRIFIGEYGFGSLTPSNQVEPTRAYMIRALKWGVPFMLYWQVYNNEPNRYFSLVGPDNQYTPIFYLHAQYLKAAREAVATFKKKKGRLPSDSEFSALAVRILQQQANVP